MAKIIYQKNVQEITLFCNLHSISKKTAWYNSGIKCICYIYQIPSKCIISSKIEPLKFRAYLLNLSFSRPLQLIKINSTESNDFFLALTYCARIQLIFTNMRGIQYFPHISLCVSPYRVPNLTLRMKYKLLMNIKKWHFKHGNKRDLIHFVTFWGFGVLRSFKAYSYCILGRPW